MKATTLTPIASVKMRIKLIDAEPRQSTNYPGKLWRPTTAVIEFSPEPGTGVWEVSTGGFQLFGQVLRKDGLNSQQRHPHERLYNWGAYREWVDLANRVRPTAGPALISLADYEVQA